MIIVQSMLKNVVDEEIEVRLLKYKFFLFCNLADAQLEATVVSMFLLDIEDAFDFSTLFIDDVC